VKALSILQSFALPDRILWVDAFVFNTSLLRRQSRQNSGRELVAFQCPQHNTDEENETVKDMELPETLTPEPSCQCFVGVTFPDRQC